MKQRFEVRYDASLDLWLVVENTYEATYSRGRFASREAAEVHRKALAAQHFSTTALSRAMTVIGQPESPDLIPYRRRRT